MGRLIPAGTGLNRYQRSQIEVHDDGVVWEPVVKPRESELSDEELAEELGSLNVDTGEDEDLEEREVEAAEVEE